MLKVAINVNNLFVNIISTNKSKKRKFHLDLVIWMSVLRKCLQNVFKKLAFIYLAHKELVTE